LAHKPFSARSLASPEFPMTARWTSPETYAAKRCDAGEDEKARQGVPCLLPHQALQ